MLPPLVTDVAYGHDRDGLLRGIHWAYVAGQEYPIRSVYRLWWSEIEFLLRGIYLAQYGEIYPEYRVG